MTHEEFDAIRLPCKLTFIEAESARRILVLGEPFDMALSLYGIDAARLTEIVKMFTDSIDKFNR